MHDHEMAQEAALNLIDDTPQLTELSVGAFTEALAGASAAPGGGAATALAGALGAALTSMVARLTLGRPRYAGVEDEMARICAEADPLRTRLLDLLEADSQAYMALMAVYRLPGDTPDQAATRAAALQATLRDAIAVPLATAEACLEALGLAARAAAHGNPNASGDAAVAALLAHAGLAGATRNVRLNLRGIEDAVYRDETAARAADLMAAGDDALAAALRAADGRG